MSHSYTMMLSPPLSSNKPTVSYMLNDDTVVPAISGMPTPITTPEELIHGDIQSSSEGDQSLHHVDPTVVSEAVAQSISQTPLFSKSPSDSSLLSSIHSLQHSPVSTALTTRVFRTASVGEKGSWFEVTQDGKGRESARRWISEERRTGSSSVNNIKFRSTTWTSAAANHGAYVEELLWSNARYRRGMWPRMDDLIDAADQAASNITSEVSKKADQKTSMRIRKPSVKVSAPRPAPAVTKSKRPPAKKRLFSEVDDNAETEEKRQRKAAKKKRKYDSWTEIVDYTPSIHHMSAAIHDRTGNDGSDPWQPKGARGDTTNDPHRDLIGTELNELELDLAETHSLDIKKYLINKRLIFQRLVQRFVDGHSAMTKTHAQDAVNIDVNKGSRMLLFYNRAGWTKPELFTKQIEQERRRQKKEKMGETIVGL